jgi:putative membrane protein
MWHGYGPDGWFGMDGPTWILGMGPHGIFGTAFVVILVVAFVLLARTLWRPAVPRPACPAGDHPAGRAQALAALELRYARGEVEREEYLQKRQDLN